MMNISQKMQSTILDSNLCFLFIGTLTFAKQPHMRKQDSECFLPIHSTCGVFSLFFMELSLGHDMKSIKPPPPLACLR
jgi:hypothetical protein